jgi:hypothetical protein
MHYTPQLLLQTTGISRAGGYCGFAKQEKNRTFIVAA